MAKQNSINISGWQTTARLTRQIWVLDSQTQTAPLATAKQPCTLWAAGSYNMTRSRMPSSRGKRKTPGSNLAFLIASYCRNQLPIKYIAALPSPKALFASAKPTPKSALSNAPLSASHLYLLNAASTSASVNLTVPAVRFCAQSGVLPSTSAERIPSNVNAAAQLPSPAPTI